MAASESRLQKLLTRGILVGASGGLGLILCLSLWVSQLAVGYAMLLTGPIVQPAEQDFAWTIRLQNGEGQVIKSPPFRVQFADSAGKLHELPQSLPVAGSSHLVRGRLTGVALGAGILSFVHPKNPGETYQFPLTVGTERVARKPGVLQFPRMGRKIERVAEGPYLVDLSPLGRLQAGFDQRFAVRVIDNEGRGQTGDVEVRLKAGELAQVGAASHELGKPAKLVAAGTLDRRGLFLFQARLLADNCTFELSWQGKSGQTKPPAAVQQPQSVQSWPGSFRLTPESSWGRSGHMLELNYESMSRRLPSFLEILDTDGYRRYSVYLAPGNTKIFQPWRIPASAHGFWRIEAHRGAHRRDDSTYSVLLPIWQGERPTQQELGQLAGQLKSARFGTGSESSNSEQRRAREHKYYDFLVRNTDMQSAEEVDTSVAWLSAQWPMQVYGKETVRDSSAKTRAELLVTRQSWRHRLRLGLLLGGGVILLMVVSLVIHDYRQTRQKLSEFARSEQVETPEMMRSAAGILLRGGVILVVMVMALLLLSHLLDRFVVIV